MICIKDFLGVEKVLVGDFGHMINDGLNQGSCICGFPVFWNYF